MRFGYNRGATALRPIAAGGTRRLDECL